MKIEKMLSVVRLWSLACLLSCSGTLSACSGGDDGAIDEGDKGLPAGNVTVKVIGDKKTVLRNPLNGWVMYMGRGWDENFWTTMGYDNMKVPELATPVKVSDYASTCYIRTSWSSLNPSEGVYVWNDPNARLTKLFKSALDRNMRLSFRIVVDGRDQGLNTPQYVFDAGAASYPDLMEIMAKAVNLLILMMKYFSKNMLLLLKHLPKSLMIRIKSILLMPMG